MKRFAPYILLTLLLAPRCHAQETPAKTIHIFVALCDNDSQGIVPVPATLGNGNDPDNNLYWGAMYGVKTFFKKSGNWELIVDTRSPNSSVLERLVFKHRTQNAYVVADAYRGNQIKSAIETFLRSAGGNRPGFITFGNTDLGIYGNADLIAYVGHNGLMDFSVESPAPYPHHKKNKVAIVLACKSQSYFQSHLEKTGCSPLLLTTGFMAPEAYTLEAALQSWLSGQPAPAIHRGAAEAYNKYQKCGIAGAMRLFYSPER